MAHYYGKISFHVISYNHLALTKQHIIQNIYYQMLSKVHYRLINVVDKCKNHNIILFL